MEIKHSDLPLTREDLTHLKAFCRRAIQRGQLWVGNGIPDLLREDYLNAALPLPDRAQRNMGVSSEAWRNCLLRVCRRLAEVAINSAFNLGATDGCDIIVVYPWRAGLAFAHGFAGFGVEHAHLGIGRNEEHPHETGERWMPLNTQAFWRVRDKVVIVADVMLATGGSASTVIQQVLELGVREDRIILLHCVAAPEGAFNLFTLYPAIGMITAALDSHLNGMGYIQPGLGDAGDKLFHDITLEGFFPIRHLFNDTEWGMLENKIRAANQ